MPALGQYAPILKTVVFLYESREDAERGERCGGTGFLISVLSDRFGEYGIRHIHAITNNHVAVYNPKGSPAPVIRVNRKSGAPDIFEFGPEAWIFRPKWHDLAISPPLDIDNNKNHDAVPLDWVAWSRTEQQEKDDEIGPADDVFMVGRFIDYDGIETNAPAVRFGHISIMD